MHTTIVKIPEKYGRISVKDISREEIEELKNELAEAAEVLKTGGLVAFPTETVYGLGGNGSDPEASGKIYAAKGRPSDNPLIIHIADRELLKSFVTEIPKTAEILMDAFWPGPLTLIFHKTGRVPLSTTGGLDTVAIRMPEHPVAFALIEASGLAVAAPSANLSGKPSPTRAEHVVEDLSGRIDVIVDGGDVEIGLESTIVDVTCEPPVILRPGFITKEMLTAVVGEVALDRGIMEKPSKDTVPKAPGMKYRHYAPKAQLTLFRGPEDEVVKRICTEAADAAASGQKTGIIATEETKARYNPYDGKWIVCSVGSKKYPYTIAHNLFRILREFDKMGAEVVFSESFSEEAFGQAIMNRLKKAAGYRIIDV